MRRNFLRDFALSRQTLAWALLLLAIACSSGCGYALSGRGAYLPAHIKIIGVPMFGNNTPVFEVEQKITAKVQAELIGRGRYEIKPDRTAVDAVLLGEIQAISVSPAAFNDQQQATRYAVTLVAKIEFRDVKNDKVIWANPQLVFTEQYDVTTTQTATDPNAFLGQNVNAMERLASEFARTVISAILESF
jgi:outer membrane lipopolysaccharide assembly protein LptE/RlpB